jgi:hypothetical protein
MKKLESVLVIMILIFPGFVGFQSAKADSANQLNWNTASVALPKSLDGCSTVFYNNTIYVVGGEDGTYNGILNTIYYSKLSSSGAPLGWQVTYMPDWASDSRPYGPPEGRFSRTNFATVCNGYLYIVGGDASYPWASPDHNSATVNAQERSTVWYVKLNPDGSLGEWKPGSSLPYPVQSHVVTSWDGHIYAIRGWTGGGGSNAILVADVQNDGSLSAWRYAGPSLPEPSWHGQSGAVYNGYIYVSGGHYPDYILHDEIYYCKIDASGNTGAWQTARLPKPMEYHGFIPLNGKLYVIGGNDRPWNYNVLNSVYSAEINSDGSIGGWVNDTTIPFEKLMFGADVNNGRIYVVGGASTTNSPTNILFYSSLVPSVFTVSVSPFSASVVRGGTVDYTISVSWASGSGTASLSLSGLPSNVGVGSFSPSSGSGGFTSDLTIGTFQAAPTGSYSLTVTATSGGVSKSASFTLTVSLPPNDYLLSASPTSGSVSAGSGSASYTVSATFKSGSPSGVSLSLDSPPSWLSWSFSPSGGSPTFTSTLTVSASSSVPSGSYSLYVKGSGGGMSDHMIQVTLAVNAATSTGTLRVNVHNVGGALISGASVRLYDSSYATLLGTQTTNSAGYVQWTGLSLGSYNIEVSRSPGISLNLNEFWGGIPVTLSSSSTTVEFTRHSQWISNILVNGVAAGSWPVSLASGQQAQVQVTVRNDEGGSSSKNVKVRLILDRDRASGYDFDQTSSSKSIGNGSTGSFSFSFTPTAYDATYYLYAVVQGEYPSGYTTTDQYDWSSAITVHEAYLSVPYYYQGDTGWCVPTSVCMAMRYYGIYVHPWDVAKALIQDHSGTGFGSSLIAPASILTYLTGAGLSGELNIVNVNTIKSKLDKKEPTILAVLSMQHAVLVTGYRIDNSETILYINDPSGYMLEKLYPYKYSQPYVQKEVRWSDLNPYIDVGSWLIGVVGTSSSPSGTLNIIGGGDYNEVFWRSISVRHITTIESSDVYIWESGFVVNPLLGDTPGLTWRNSPIHLKKIDSEDSFLILGNEVNKLVINPTNNIQNYLFELTFSKQGVQKWTSTKLPLSVPAFSMQNPPITEIKLKDVFTEDGEYIIRLWLYKSDGTLCDRIELPPIEYTSSSLRVYVRNVNDQLRSGATVVLYDSSMSKVDQKTTGSGGYVDWSSLANGSYNVEVYYPSPAGLGLTEFWGGSSVTVSGSTTLNFKRHTQWISNIQVNGVNPGSWPVSASTGTSNLIWVTVKNDESGYSAKNVKVRLIFDRDRSAPYDFDQTYSPHSISSGSSESFDFRFTPQATGIYYFYAVIYGEYPAGFLYTDQWDWPSAVNATPPQTIPPELTLFPPEINGLTVTINGVTTSGRTSNTITRINWDWGDGHAEDHWFPASHTYSLEGSYLVKVTSYQSDGMTKSVTLSVTVSTSQKAGSSIPVAWSKELYETHWIGGGRLIANDDGTFIIGGQKTQRVNGLGYPKGNIMKIDSNGNSIWEYSLDSSVECNDILKTNDGKILILCANMLGPNYLIMLDANGNFISKINMDYLKETNFLRKIVKTDDNNYLILGGYMNVFNNTVLNENIVLIKISEQGKLISENKYSDFSANGIIDICLTKDNNVLIIGDKKISENLGNIFLIKINQSGSIVFKKIFENPTFTSPLSIIQSSTGEYVIAGVIGSMNPWKSSRYLMILNQDGNIVTIKNYNDVNNFLPTQIIEVSGYYMMLSDGRTTNGNLNIYITKIKYTGEILWDKQCVEDINEEANSIKETLNNSFIISCYSNTNNTYLKLIRTQEILDSNYDFIDVNVKQQDNSPLTPDTAILYDSSGHEVKRISPTSSSFIFSEIAPGTYNIEVYKDGELLGDSKNISVSSSGTVSITIIVNSKPKCARAQIIVKYTDGTAVTPQTAILYDSAWNEITRINPTSNSFNFTNLKQGTYNVEVYQKNMLIGEAADIQLSSNQTAQRTITTTERKDLTVYVYKDDGASPLSQANIRVLSWDGYNKRWVGSYTSKETDQNGRTVVNVWPTTKSGEKYKVEAYYFEELQASNLDVQVNQNNGGSINLVTNIKSSAFDPLYNGFNFINSNRTPDEVESIDTIQKNFENIPIANQIPEISLPIQSYVINLMEKTTEGHCFGMVTTAKYYYDHPNELEITYAESSLHNVEQDKVLDEISKRQISQIYDPYLELKTMLFELDNKTVSGLLDFNSEVNWIKSQLDQNKPVLLAVEGSRTSGGELDVHHALLAIGYSEQGGILKLRVYGPNTPGRVQLIRIVKDQIGNYAIDGGKAIVDSFHIWRIMSDYGPTNLSWSDVISHTSELIKILTDNLGGEILKIEAHSPVSLMVTDPSGRRVGYSSETNSEINELPSALYFDHRFEPETILIINPAKGSYKVETHVYSQGTYEIVTTLSRNSTIVLETKQAGQAVVSKPQTYLLTYKEEGNQGAEVSMRINSITILVKDSSKMPVVGVQVTSTNQPAGQSQLSGLTGSDGSITFTDVQNGLYEFQATKSDYYSKTESLDNRHNVTVNKTMILGKTQLAFLSSYFPIFVIMGIIVAGAIFLVWDRSRRRSSGNDELSNLDMAIMFDARAGVYFVL